MGNEPRHKRAIADSNLHYYSTVNHPHHGQVGIYTSKAVPMTFIMKVDRHTVESRLFHLFQQIQEQNSSSLVLLYGFKIERASQCSPCKNCPPGDRTVQFWQYLNYSLSTHIKDRIKKASSFTEHEVWHVVQAVCEGWRVLQNFGLIWEIHPSNMLITPEGKVKCQWSHLKMKNSHLRYYQLLTGKYEMGDSQRSGHQRQLSQTSSQTSQFFSPEEQRLLRLREYTNHLNLQKSCVYKLGLLLLYMTNFSLFVQPPPTEILRLIFNNLAEQGYPQALIRLIQGCIQPHPMKRWSMTAVRQYSKGFMSEEYELIINDGRKEDTQEYNMQAQMRMERERMNRGERSRTEMVSRPRHTNTSFHLSSIEQPSREDSFIDLGHSQAARQRARPLDRPQTHRQGYM